jgi:prepilin-type N-terminal cleavage/methylation domain-containing protein
MMKRFTRPSHAARGFTIIELMVATAVFAIVLVVVTTGIIQVTRVYYKGITESTTQDTARGIIDIISQAIQFSGGDITPTSASAPGVPAAFCIGSQQFSYALGYQLMDDPDPDMFQTPHVLVVNTVSGCSGSTSPQNVRDEAVVGRELLGPRMRLSDLSVTNLGNNLYRVSVRVVYGDDDLLSNPTATNAVCQSVRSGTQFCAVSDLSTVVIKRVQ